MRTATPETFRDGDFTYEWWPDGDDPGMGRITKYQGTVLGKVLWRTAFDEQYAAWTELKRNHNKLPSGVYAPVTKRPGTT